MPSKVAELTTRWQTWSIDGGTENCYKKRAFLRLRRGPAARVAETAVFGTQIPRFNSQRPRCRRNCNLPGYANWSRWKH